jgi:hypothetical protein
MSFRARLLAACSALAALAGVFVVGVVLPPLRGQAGGSPLLPLGSPAEITALVLYPRNRQPLELRRRDGGWEASEGGRSYPASAERAEALAVLLLGLKRGPQAADDPAARAELGLGEGRVSRLVVRRGAGKADLGLLVGLRAPGGEEDYVGLEGQDAVYRVRGNLSILFAQDRSYWLDLFVLPDAVRAETIRVVAVRGRLDLGPGAGSLRGDYSLVRSENGWAMPTEPGLVNGPAAEAMAQGLAQLEGEDLLEAPAGAPAPAGGAAPGAPPGGLEVTVSTRDGATYSFTARREGDRIEVRTSWSPWIYPMNPVLLARAIRPASALLARP